MKSDSELMNELAHTTDYLRVLTEEESNLLKKTILDIYKDFAVFCDTNKLTYMMSGGSCLGAVRHKGFIPWDDDLDIMMPRKDYNRFIELCSTVGLGEMYELDYPRKEKDAKTVFLKIFKKNTLNQEIYDENSPFCKGVYIDVFALDSVPKGSFAQLLKGFIANLLQFISIIVRMAQYQSQRLKEFYSLDKSLNRRYKLKMFFGKIFSVVPHRYWVYWFDCFVASSKSNNPVGIPTGRKYYNGEIFESSVFFPPQKAIFEGVEVFIPADYDTYLRNLYGDYMQLPPENKRERHFIVNFKI